VVTLRQLAPQRSSPTGHKVLHHPALAARQVMPLLVGSTMGAKDISDLDPLRGLVPGIRPGTHGLAVLKAGIIQQVQR
jgi:hypothetical protein